MDDTSTKDLLNNTFITEPELNDNNVNNEVDEITLSLLMNKNHYRKYISQTDPEQSNLDKITIDDNHKYKHKILDLTSRMIDNPDLQISTSVNGIFNTYTKYLVNHFKMKELEKQNDYNNDDEDVLFSNIEQNDNNYEQTSGSSLWGKDRVIKKGYTPIANYDMRMFSKR